MTRLVLDGSVAMGWCFDDEADHYTVEALRVIAVDSALVPTTLPTSISRFASGFPSRPRTPVSAERRRPPAFRSSGRIDASEPRGSWPS
jgi:hypothetical protein